MEKLTLQKFLRDKEEVRFILKTIDNAPYEDTIGVTLERLAFLLQGSVGYEEFPSFKELVKLTITSMKKHDDDTYKDYLKLAIDLKAAVRKFLNEMISRVHVDVYFYGEDKYNLMNKKYLRSNIYKMDDFYEINYIKKDENRDYHFLVLLLEDEKDFVCDFNVKNTFDKVVSYNKVASILFEMSKSLYNRDYDYNFLKNKIEESKYEDIKTLIVGNGYTRCAIDENVGLSKAINLALPTQDIKRSFDIVKKMVNNNKSINKCVIGIGYYSLFYNLEDAYGEDDYFNPIRDIYAPLLEADKKDEKDKFITLEDYISDDFILDIFNLDKVGEYMNFINYKANKDYFNDSWSRKKSSAVKDKEFGLLVEEDKNSYGIWRACQHNKILETKKEDDRDALLDLLKYLEYNSISPIVVIMPVTPYYKRFLDKKYIENLNEVITSFSDIVKFKVIDFNNGYEFSDDDFIDVDHLNEVGCVRLTTYLNNSLKWLK